MSLIPIKLLCNRRPKSSSPSSGSGSSSSGSGTTTNSAALPDWFYFNTEENSVHCKYPLVGDSEVSAFGYSSSSGSGGGGGSIDPSVLADYVTKSELNAAGYLSSADMSNFVTEQELSGMGYVTNSTLNTRLNSYVTKTSLSQMGYVTNSALSNMGYLTKSDVSNMGYVTQTAMDATLSGYVKMSYLNQQFAFTANQITALKNLVGNGEISAFGSGSSSGGGEGTSVEVVDDLTHHSNADRYKALSAYQGYVLDNKIDELPTMSTLSSYVTNTALNTTLTSYAKKSDLTSYVKKTDLNTTLASYATKEYLNVEGYVTFNDLDYYPTLQYLSNQSYVKSSDLNTTLASYVKKTDFNTTLATYNTRLNNIEAILAYMQLCEDSNGNAYITFTCPVVSTGEIEAYK